VWTSPQMGCRVLDRVVIGRMISSTRSASDLGAGSGTMLGVDGLADSADLERGYHLRCRSKGMVAHHYAACTNVFGRIICDIELEFQGLCFFCAPFLGETAVRCQVFPKNVGKVIKVKPKRDSVENHALLGLPNGVAHLLCNSTLHPRQGGHWSHDFQHTFRIGSWCRIRDDAWGRWSCRLCRS